MDVLTAGIESSILKKINVLEVIAKGIKSKMDNSQLSISKISEDLNILNTDALNDIQSSLSSTVGVASDTAATIASELEAASGIIDLSSGGCLGAIGGFLKDLSSNAAKISDGIMSAITLPSINGLGDFVNIGSFVSGLVNSSGIIPLIKKLEALIDTMPCLNPSFKADIQNRISNIKSDLYIGQTGFDADAFGTQMMTDLYSNLTNVPSELKDNITGSIKSVQDTAAASVSGAKDQAIAMKTKMSDSVASNIPKLKLPSNFI